MWETTMRGVIFALCLASVALFLGGDGGATWKSSLIDVFSPPTIVTLNLFKNGMDTYNITHVIKLRDHTWEDVKSEFAALLYPGESPTQLEVYTSEGDRLTHVKSLMSGDDVYLLKDGELFMHPGKYVGYTRTIAGLTVQTLSLLPKVFLVKDFLSKSECDVITDEAASYEDPHVSAVFEGESKGASPTRTSTTAYVTYPEYLVTRAFNLTKVPYDKSYLYPDHQLQVIHYDPNQYFHPHHDSFFASAVGDEPWFENGVRNRFLTLFLYLNNVEDGGETAFIAYDEFSAFHSDKYQIYENNPCDKATVSMKPSKGDGILFYNLQVGKHMTGEVEWSALHSGCGVKKGEKWACNVWMYNRPFTDPAAIEVMRNVKLIKE